MDNHQSMPSEFNFSNSPAVPAEGQAGGIEILCHDEIINFTDVALSHQEVHYIVQVVLSSSKWLFLAIYVHNNTASRIVFWENLNRIADCFNRPCLLGGDFNEIIRTNEKLGGQGFCPSRDNKFFHCLNYCRMLDLGFSGSKFTWTTLRRHRYLILERLDRINSNVAWLEIFPEAYIKLLQCIHSDSCPLLLL